MAKVFLSPSAQEHNVGVGDYGTEEYEMNLIADLVYPHLTYLGFDVKRNDKDMTLNQIINASNDFSPDIHLAIHSNASAKDFIRGTEVYYYTGSSDGYRLADSIYKYISELTPSDDKGTKSSTYYGELRETSGVAVIVEIIYHTNTEDSIWLMDNRNTVAEAIVHGVCDYFGIDYKPMEQEIDNKPDIDKLSLIQPYLDNIKGSIDSIINILNN